MTAPFVVTPSSAADAIAPDGSDVRFLAGLTCGGMASFSIGSGDVSIAVRHRTIEELWVFTHGRGEMWISPDGDLSQPAAVVQASDSVRIPVGASFQFRPFAAEGLTAVGVTMPPWPGDGEAIRTVGPWEPTLRPGPGLAAE